MVAALAGWSPKFECFVALPARVTAPDMLSVARYR
jgi:hypothetical protein